MATLTTANLHNQGVGSHVKDTLALALRATAAAAITSATTTTGAWVEAGYPKGAVVEMVTGTMTGAGVTSDVEIQGADDGSATNLVSYGRFAQVGETEDDLTVYLEVPDARKRYMRAVIVTAGTVTNVDPVIVVRDSAYKAKSARTA
jgi:hypothetical protein